MQDAWLRSKWTLVLLRESPRCQPSRWHRRSFVLPVWGYYSDWGEGEQTDEAFQGAFEGFL